MRHIRYILLIINLLGVFSFSISAQNALGCDGRRYVQDIFPQLNQTTVQYGSNTGLGGITLNLNMDIVQPQGDTLSRRPLIVLAFGGGFVQGQRSDMLATCQAYARKGYVCATIDYRLYPIFALGLPDSAKITPYIIDAAHDMKAAIRFFKKDAATTNTYKIDTNNIIVGGISAGAITALLVAQMDSTDPIPTWMRTIIAQRGGFEGQSGNPGYRATAKGVINMSGALYRKEWLDAGDAAMVSYHGTADNVVAYGFGTNVYNFYGDGSGTIAPYAAGLGIPNVLVTVPNGGHTDIYTSPNFAANLLDFNQKSVVFIQKLICGERPLRNDTAIEGTVVAAPNPSNDQISLIFGGDASLYDHQVVVIDALGRVVFKQDVAAGSGLILSKNELGKGLYWVQIRQKQTQKRQILKVLLTD